MKRFRLLKQTRQSTEYSCGACALQSVLSYWGKELDEADLMTLLHTTEESGTYPDDMVRVARQLGFEAEVEENLTLDQVEDATARGIPVIALSQAWRSRLDSASSAEEDWKNGHYIVVLAVDEDYVYFEDPYVRMGKGFMPRKAFEDHWHHVMGGDSEKGRKLMRLGIFIRGEEPAESQRFKKVDLADLDFSKMNSMNLVVTQFQGALLPYDFVNDLKGLWETGVLRPDAFFFLRKDKEGKLSVMEGGRLQEEENVLEINALISALADLSVPAPEPARAEASEHDAREGDFGLSVSDIQRIADKLPPDHSAVIVLFENVWERTFKEIAGKYKGSVTHQTIIPADSISDLVRGGSLFLRKLLWASLPHQQK
jgi:predicted double-glycine peptidase